MINNNTMAEGRVQTLFEDFWTWRLTRSPEFASLVGDKKYNAVLETLTEGRFQDDQKQCKQFIAQAKELLIQLLSSGSNQATDLTLNLEFFIAEVKTFVDGFPFKGYLFPMNYMEGVQVDFQKLAEWVGVDEPKPSNSPVDYQHLIDRYKRFPVLADQVGTMLARGVSLGLTNHQVSMAGVEAQCKEHLLKVEDTVFWKPFVEMGGVSPSEAYHLRNQAKEAIETALQPAFKSLAEAVAKYSTRQDTAATSLPGGKDYYAACLAFHTSTNLTAEQIHKMGLEEVDKIEAKMKQVITEQGHEMTLAEFSEKLRNDPSNFFTSGEELINTFREIIDTKISGKLPELFHSIPVSKLEVCPGPNPGMPAAYYIVGTSNGSRPGRLFVNTRKFASQPRYEMISLTLHETLPGHHLQGSYTVEKEDWPMFRKVMEDRVYSQAPSRFPINTAYVEGWGLYSETLGFDLGLYIDPMDRYGHYSEEIFRACRLVVDTGLHALGWSREKAVSYMAEHTAASLDNIRQEVDRYITWPGQATGYKIGQIKILELRARAEEKLGIKFDIRDFHMVVLESVGPLYMLEKQIDKYIEDKIRG